MQNSWLIFTDLDGTLLDDRTYSFKEALPALALLRAKHVPIIPCTSKTHLEVIRIREQAELSDPFIVENGSAIFIPPGYFARPVSSIHMDNYEVLILGKGHRDVRRCFETVRQKFKLRARGFSEMSVNEICDRTLLPEKEARIAKRRFFSEPFVCDSDLLKNQALTDYLQQHGCRLLRGNRFFHLLGNSDKGYAVHILKRLFESRLNIRFKTLGLGDSKNDIDLLNAVDQAVLIRKADGKYGIDLELKNLYKTQMAGPAGWREAIEYFVK